MCRTECYIHCMVCTSVVRLTGLCVLRSFRLIIVFILTRITNMLCEHVFIHLLAAIIQNALARGTHTARHALLTALTLPDMHSLAALTLPDMHCSRHSHCPTCTRSRHSFCPTCIARSTHSARHALARGTHPAGHALLAIYAAQNALTSGTHAARYSLLAAFTLPDMHSLVALALPDDPKNCILYPKTKTRIKPKPNNVAKKASKAPHNANSPRFCSPHVRKIQMVYF